MRNVICKVFNIIMKLKVALYAGNIGVMSLHFVFIYEKLGYQNNAINRIFIRPTACIVLENRFNVKFYFSFCYQPNPICEGAPEGEYPVTVSKEVLYGFRLTVTEKNSHSDP